MKKILFLIIPFILTFNLITFSQSSQMYSYSVYAVLENQIRNETLLGNISIIQGYSFNFDSKGNINATFKITPLNDLGNQVRTKIVIDSVNMYFEDTIDLNKNKNNYVASITYEDENEEKVLDIYILVNNLEKMKFIEEQESVKKNSISFRIYQNSFSYHNKDELVSELNIKLNDLVFVGISNLLDFKNAGYYGSFIIKDLKVGVNAQNNKFYVFLQDKTELENLEFEGIIVPVTFTDNSLKFNNDFYFSVQKNFNSFKIVDLRYILTNEEVGFYLGEHFYTSLNFEQFGFYLGRELEKLANFMENNLFMNFGLNYIENKYNLFFNLGSFHKINNIEFQNSLGYNFISNNIVFSSFGTYEF
ncbi:hypothetical protein PW5551_09570 [Petrotoga sp. 9PW.55.5.1]|uniref:hypothetical protein n=1 Tax=Petrotoga sp. 9PW.55.5.1 TaxID=1308979 RepID=UPI000DC3C1AB|nr:hypothetical protein [Petrotoga sp. 9PW.55.5.1]RAO98499.1 hypothetical protein PW5551_09570 [Petrotoga sp. 9PW.55.5.1]